MASLSTTMLSTPFVQRQPAIASFRALPAAFGLRSNTRGGRVVAMASYTVKLITPDGPLEFECPDDVYILDQAEEEGIDIPYSCRAGSCSSCAGKVVSGEIDQSDGNFLDDEQIEAGFALTCVTYPKSNVVIETHKGGGTGCVENS